MLMRLNLLPLQIVLRIAVIIRDNPLRRRQHQS